MDGKIGLKLSKEQREELEEFYRKEKQGSAKVRSLVIKLLDQGEPVLQVAQTVGFSRISVWRWEQRYHREGLDGLYDRPRTGRTPIMSQEDKQFVLHCVEQDPRSLGVDSSNWTLWLLAQHLEQHRGVTVSTEAIRRHLHRCNYKLKRPSPVVITRDPQYEEKRGNWKRWSRSTYRVR